MIFPGFPGVLSFFQVFQVEWEPWILFEIEAFEITYDFMNQIPLISHAVKEWPKFKSLSSSAKCLRIY